jgi:diguanylate cyclase (GGDEF)-like protein
MDGKSGQQAPNAGARSDSRLRPVLLTLAFAVVAGYAAWSTDLGGSLGGPMLTGLSSIPFAAVAAAAALLGCAGLIMIRRGRPRVPFITPKTVTDPLADLAGREQFLSRLADQLGTHAEASRQLAIHLVDVDRFRRVNALIGEAEGDAFLRSVAERLLVLVENPERLARIGDDEFAVIQPEAGGARHAEIFARRILDILKDACAQIPRHARPAASVGVAVSPEHGSDALALLHNASLALAAAKRSGGDAFQVFAREMEMNVEARLGMEKAIGDGLHQGWFELHFQPQYDLRSRRLTGFEALVRMNHPEHGQLLPETFLPVAEESGLIHPLGEWIIRDALTHAMAWPGHLTLSLNIAPTQLAQADIAGTLLKALSNAGFEGSRLQVEISEAVLLDPPQSVRDQLQRLKSRGVTVVVDDFGLARSNLASLARSACDVVKLDRTLVKRIGEEPEAENLVRGLIGAARAFDLYVRAEGIEQPAQAHFLISNGVAIVQGHLFGRAAPARELAAIVAKDVRKGMPQDRPQPAASVAAA